jgi:hypothetical protein
LTAYASRALAGIAQGHGGRAVCILMSPPGFFSFISSSMRGVGPYGTSGELPAGRAGTPGGPPVDGDGNKVD